VESNWRQTIAEIGESNNGIELCARALGVDWAFAVKRTAFPGSWSIEEQFFHPDGRQEMLFMDGFFPLPFTSPFENLFERD